MNNGIMDAKVILARSLVCLPSRAPRRVGGARVTSAAGGSAHWKFVGALLQYMRRRTVEWRQHSSVAFVGPPRESRNCFHASPSSFSFCSSVNSTRSLTAERCCCCCWCCSCSGIPTCCLISTDAERGKSASAYSAFGVVPHRYAENDDHRHGGKHNYFDSSFGTIISCFGKPQLGTYKDVGNNLANHHQWFIL